MFTLKEKYITTEVGRSWLALLSALTSSAMAVRRSYAVPTLALLCVGAVCNVAMAEDVTLDGVRFKTVEEMKEAQREFDKEMEGNKRYQHEKQASILISKQRFEEAVKELDAAIELDPDVQTVYVKRGIALYNLGRADEALPDFDKSILLNNRGKGWNWWPQYHKGVALGLAGDMQNAVVAFSESILLYPRIENYYGRAIAYVQMRQPDEALTDVNAAQKLNPSDQKLKRFSAFLEEQISAQTYLRKMAQEPGARQSESGLVYFVLKEGDGQSPAAQDTVKVHYHGMLVDGTVFDSSVDRGQPISFPLTKVISCWTEGVQKMKVGGKSKLVCPAHIAYGDRGAGARIKPGATLVFDVELLAIE